jgi:hypothetical protein
MEPHDISLKNLQQIAALGTVSYGLRPVKVGASKYSRAQNSNMMNRGTGMARQGSKTRRIRNLDEDPFIEWLAWLMDESIRIGPWSIGIDPLLGLIPGLGDMAGAAASAMLISRALNQGIAKGAVMRMVLNVGIDSLLGAVPFVGDIFDFAYKSNIRNLEIYREALRGERQPVRDWFFVLFVTVVTLAVLIIPLIGIFYLGKLIWNAGVY